MVFSCVILKRQDKDHKNKINELENKISEKIKDIKKLEESLALEKRNSYIDSLTGIYNRKYLNENAQQIVNLAERFNQSVQLLLLDLDNFKQINDNLGHIVGDNILKKVAEKIRSVARHTDTYVRLGGDEFFIILPGTDSEGVELFSKRLESEISIIPKELGLNCPNFGASIGAINHTRGSSFEASINSADGMMYRVKERRKKR